MQEQSLQGDVRVSRHLLPLYKTTYVTSSLYSLSSLYALSPLSFFLLYTLHFGAHALSTPSLEFLSSFVSSLSYSLHLLSPLSRHSFFRCLFTKLSSPLSLSSIQTLFFTFFISFSLSFPRRYLAIFLRHSFSLRPPRPLPPTNSTVPSPNSPWHAPQRERESELCEGV